MPDAHYFRSQATLYFELARRMSLHVDAEYCRIVAERHAAKAAALEADAASGPPSSAISTANANVVADPCAQSICRNAPRVAGHAHTHHRFY